MFVNPVRIDTLCGGVAAETCGDGFYCKMPSIKDAANLSGACVPNHLKWLPMKAFVIDSTQK